LVFFSAVVKWSVERKKMREDLKKLKKYEILGETEGGSGLKKKILNQGGGGCEGVEAMDDFREENGEKKERNTEGGNGERGQQLDIGLDQEDVT
jgi:hypothetical protein